MRAGFRLDSLANRTKLSRTRFGEFFPGKRLLFFKIIASIFAKNFGTRIKQLPLPAIYKSNANKSFVTVLTYHNGHLNGN